MDPQSLDAAVQNMLSGLYPPFDATAPVVLSQLFRVLEANYRGDGLCCLLDFLIPSKRLLEHVRQAACAPYASRVFLHEGWPLCLREKVVVHLSPLNPLLLRPGDFYLQVEPCGEQSARLAVKCLSRALTAVDTIPVSEAACSLLFTPEWLEGVNRGGGRPELRSCLVATGDGVVPVPWRKIAAPEFVRMPQGVDSGCKDSPLALEHCCEAAQRQSGSAAGDPRGAPSKYPGLIKVERGSWGKSDLFVVPSLCDIISENLEGEYVNLLGFSEERKPELPRPAKANVLSAAAARPAAEASPETQLGPASGTGEAAAPETWTCGKEQDSADGPCTPCRRRKLSRDPQLHEARCRYRESYAAALQNPVSFSSGPTAAVLEERGPSRPGAQPPPEGSGEAAPERRPDSPKEESRAEQVAKPGNAKPPKPPAEPASVSSKFSFLKGHRSAASPVASSTAAEKAVKAQEEPRKRASLVCSPRMARTKPTARKGNDKIDVALSEIPIPRSLEGSTEETSPTDAPLLPRSSPQEPFRREVLSSELMSSGFACLPGSTDRFGRPVLQITTSSPAWQASGCSGQEVTDLLLFLASLPRKEAHDTGLTVVIDARKDPIPPTLPVALDSVQKAYPGSICAVLILAEKETAPHPDKFPGLQVELLSSLKALGRHVDSSQLTRTLEGTFPYCHHEWVQFFQKMHHFTDDLQKASELLQNTTRELEKRDQLGSPQEVMQEMGRHQQLMQGVLSNVHLLSLQREGGATLARLRKEAARLSFSPAARSGIEGALGLYNLVEEQVHSLVARSNCRSEHLEFLLRIRELEAEFHKISLWMKEEGELELCEMESAECSQESVEESYQRFKKFFKEATVHYNRGLSLSKEAAKVQGSRFPEMGAFEAAKGAFQAKLTVFYMGMEMRGAELETLLDLCKFRDKVARFNLDCKQRLARWETGATEPWAPESPREAEEGPLQLPSEFSPETFQQMKVHASSMRGQKGLVVWREAFEQCQEAARILERPPALCLEEPEAGGKGRPLGVDPDPLLDVPGEEADLDDAPGGSGSRDGLSGRHRGLGRTVRRGNPSRGTGKEREGTEGDYLASPCAVLETESGRPPGDPLAPPQGSHAQASGPEVDRAPAPCEGLPPADWTVPRGGRPGRRKEKTQYFQLSRHGSFSSEDTDSQNSTEEPLGSGATLPVDSPGPRGTPPQGKALGIVYLENHHPARLSGAASQ